MDSSAPLAPTVLVIGDSSPWTSELDAQPWEAVRCDGLDATQLATAMSHADAVLWVASGADALQGLRRSPALITAASDLPVLVMVPAIEDAALPPLMRTGIDDVLVLPPGRPGATTELTRAVTVAMVRNEVAVLRRKGGSIDLATGLPTRTQWLDHLSQLCALREREPAPMAVLVLRTIGSAQIEASLGAESLALVQRKLAVRLRAALRASDVVGTVAPEAYAVLLSWMESAADADLVAAKLLRSLEQPVRVGTEQAAVAVATGVAYYGVDGKEGPALLRTALGRAGAVVEGERGPAAAQPLGLVDRGRHVAANDPAQG